MSQQDIYFDQIRNIDSSIYNVGGYVKCMELNVEKIKAAHKCIINNNDAFGLAFSEQNGSVVQYLTETRDDELIIIDLSLDKNSLEVANNWVNNFFDESIFYYDKLLYSSKLLKVTEKEYWYVCKCHHLIMDGVGFANWAFKLSDYYNNETPRYQTESWSKIVDKDKQYLESNIYRKNKSYWQSQFENGIPTKIFSKIRENHSHKSQRYNRSISRDKLNSLHKIAQQFDVNIANLFIGVISIYINYAYQQNSITFGLPAHNRKSHLEKGMLNVFTNTSPITVSIEKNDTFISLVRSINKKQKENFRHQRFPTGHLLRLLNLQGEAYAFSGINFNFLNLDYTSLQFLKKSAAVIYQPQQQDQLPLTVNFFDGGENALELQYDFHPIYFDLQDIKMMASRIEHILSQLLNSESWESPINQLSVIPESEKKLILNKFIGERYNIGHSLTVDSLFTKQALEEPCLTALNYENVRLSYGELNSKIEGLASYMTQQGCKNGILVGLYMQRSIEMVIGLLAILKTGAAYVPLDPSLPQERLKYIIKDTGLEHILTTPSFKEGDLYNNATFKIVIDYQNWQDFDIADNELQLLRDLSDTAYVIYTSGSTGNPKGVEVSHRALLNRIDWMDREYEMTVKDKVLQKTPFGFDVSVWEFLWTLSCGGQLVIARPEGHKDPRYLSELIKNQGITKLHFVPSMLNIMLKHGNLELCTSLKQVFCSGEELHSKQVQDFYSLCPNTELHNLYGPTEAAIDVSFWPCAAQLEQPISIGKAIQNTQLLVLNDKLNLTPIGVVGELYISGMGLANGYLNKPDLTDSAFINNPYYRKHDTRSSKKLYKTGDLVRYRSDGNLEYIGRNDSQVKIRGQRIELLEIENVLLNQSEVDEVKVLVQGDAKDILVAYLSLKDHSQNILKKIESNINASLPSYMVPGQFIIIEKWPLTANGKLDVKKLKNIRARSANDPIYLPETQTQAKLRQLWAQLLKIDESEISINENFFRIGGNSLQCSEMIHVAQERFNFKFTLSDIFQNPTITELALCIEDYENDYKDIYSLKQMPIPTSCSLSFVQYRIWLAEQLSGSSNKHNMSGGVKLIGSICLDKIRKSLNAMVRDNLMLSTCFGLSKNGEPYQYIDLSKNPAISFYDLSDLSDELKAQSCNDLISSFCSEIFSLQDSLMFKICVITLSDEEVLLYFSFHHIICDGWSINIALNKFLESYDNVSSKASSVSVTHNYFDYVYWQQEFLSTSEATLQKQFWKEYLSGCNPILDLPFRKLKENNQAQNLINEELPLTLLKDLQQLANELSSSLPSLIHCALVLVLSRMTAERDLVIGIPVTGRNIGGTGDIFGPFINNLPVRTQVQKNQLFIEFLKEQTKNLQQVLSHQELPFEQILELLPHIDRSSKETPLFQVCLNILSLPTLEFESAGINVEPEPILANDNKFNLTLYISQHSDGLTIQCNHSREYCPEDVANILHQLSGLLAKLVVTRGDIFCSQLSFYSPENSPLLAKENETDHFNEHTKTIIECFESSVLNMPNALALSYQQRNWSYQQLNYICSLYAERFVESGVCKGDIVAIVGGRRDSLIISMLAVLKAGGAFLILPEDEPKRRIQEKLSVLKTVFLLNISHIELPELEKMNSVNLLKVNLDYLDKEKDNNQFSQLYLEGVKCLGNDLAYIAFTSGTEGMPKAIKGRHSSLTAYTPWLIDKYNISYQDRFALISGLAHDPLHREVFTALIANASIHIPNEEEYDFTNVSNWIEKTRISVLNITPSLATVILLNGVSFKYLSHIFFCGEPLSVNTAMEILQQKESLNLINMYGATETCRALSIYDIEYKDVNRYDLKGYIPLGRGVAGVEVLILNEQNQKCGIGEVGQIAIKAKHLALGYYNNTDLTNTKFILNHEASSEHKNIYLTGDYGRFDYQGDVCFIGRNDRQLKVRGHRIEPIEIETIIKREGLVDNILVTAIQDVLGDNQLVAYIVKNENETKGEREFIKYFRVILPEYMVPNKIIFIESVPFTLNGKIDWLKLSNLCLKQQVPTVIKPNTNIEQRILKIFSELLNKPSICVSDNFFDIGGNSITAVRVLTLLNKEFATEISFSDFFERSTIRKLSEFIEFRKLEKTVISHKSTKKNITSI